MKYAVISDVHGNRPALRAVLEDARRQGASHYLFAGDYCISGPQPDECLAAIRSIPEKTVIRGNEEKYLEDLDGQDLSRLEDGQMQVSCWCYRNLRREHLDYLRNLPHTAELECGGVRIRMAHSSAAFIGPGTFYRWNSVTVADRNREPGADPEAVLRGINLERGQDPGFLEAVSALEKGVYIFGHSHLQWSWQDPDRDIYLINPGSCGLPLDGLRDSVPYTLLEITEGGRVKIEERRVPFDKQAYIRAFRQTGQFREANVWSRVIQRELAAATEHVHFFLAFTEQYAQQIGDERRPYAPDTWNKAFELWDAQQEGEN